MSDYTYTVAPISKPLTGGMDHALIVLKDLAELAPLADGDLSFLGVMAAAGLGVEFVVVFNEGPIDRVLATYGIELFDCHVLSNTMTNADEFARVVGK